MLITAKILNWKMLHGVRLLGRTLMCHDLRVSLKLSTPWRKRNPLISIKVNVPNFSKLGLLRPMLSSGFTLAKEKTQAQPL
jgi:hypothetical protein